MLTELTEVDIILKTLTVTGVIKYAVVREVIIMQDFSAKSVTIPSTETSIGNRGYKGWCSLTSVIIPNSVTSIGNEAFAGCTSLKSIVIPNSVKSIGERAFAGCTSLKSVTLPNAATIGKMAFAGCIGLSSVTIPSINVKVHRQAFNGCVGLASITFPDPIKWFPDRSYYSAISKTNSYSLHFWVRKEIGAATPADMAEYFITVTETFYL